MQNKPEGEYRTSQEGRSNGEEEQSRIEIDSRYWKITIFLQLDLWSIECFIEPKEPPLELVRLELAFSERNTEREKVDSTACRKKHVKA